MPFRSKIDVLSKLKEKGYSTYRLRDLNLLSESTINRLRNSDTSISIKVLERICCLLDMQPGDIIEYIPDQPSQDS